MVHNRMLYENGFRKKWIHTIPVNGSTLYASQVNVYVLPGNDILEDQEGSTRISKPSKRTPNALQTVSDEFRRPVNDDPPFTRNEWAWFTDNTQRLMRAIGRCRLLKTKVMIRQLIHVCVCVCVRVCVRACVRGRACVCCTLAKCQTTNF